MGLRVEACEHHVERTARRPQSAIFVSGMCPCSLDIGLIDFIFSVSDGGSTRLATKFRLDSAVDHTARLGADGHACGPAAAERDVAHCLLVWFGAIKDGEMVGLWLVP